MARGTQTKGDAALRGITAVVAGLGAGELVAGAIPPHASPIAAVGGVLIELAPTWAIELGIQLFGSWDKVAILVSIVLVVVGLGAVAGLVERVRPPMGMIIVVAFGAAGLLAALLRGGNAMSGLPGLVGVVVAVLAFRLLPRALRRRPVGVLAAVPDVPEAAASDALEAAEPAPAAPEVGRRAFLAWAGGLTLVGALAAVGGATMSGLGRAGSAIASALRLPVPARPLPPIPAAAELAIPGLTPVVTPVADFYRVDTAFVVPKLAPEDWRLRIHGLVEQELELGWDDLVSFEFEEFDVTLVCVSNPIGGEYAGNARWLGTRIAPILDLAGPLPESDMAFSTSVDGWTASTPLETLRDPERSAILAIGMNGVPLPPEHGAPVRMIVPGLYGYVSATKWVTDIELTRFDRRTAYWTTYGWAPRAPVRLQSRIDVPQPGVALQAGPMQLAGVAWHPFTGIAGVEVRVDEGPWLAAELAAAIGIDTWVQWHLPWEATAGHHTLAVRAIGADGEVQTAARQGGIPDGATGHHSFAVRVEG